MPTKNQEQSSNREGVPRRDGLTLSGTVAARRRREVKQRDGKVRYCISLVIQCAARQYTLDRWSDAPVPPGTPAIGESVEIPVEARGFLSHGAAMVALNWGSLEEASSF